VEEVLLFNKFSDCRLSP